MPPEPGRDQAAREAPAWLPLPAAPEPLGRVQAAGLRSRARAAEAKAAYESTKDLLEGGPRAKMRAERERLEARAQGCRDFVALLVRIKP
jgi:hypothetical protein